jgi:hypothetical protein
VDRYQVTVRQNNAKGPVVHRGKTKEVRMQTKELSSGEKFEWIVKACNILGCGKSERGNFVTKENRR